MEATSLCSPVLPPQPFPATSRRHRKIELRRQKGSSVRFFAMGRDAQDWDFRGHLVDKSMIVLRKRIHEMKMAERNYEPPADWMEWEKRYYTSYDSRICTAMGVLQAQLMNTRPSLALGLVALITLSVPVSTAMIMFNLMEAATRMLSGIHLN